MAACCAGAFPEALRAWAASDGVVEPGSCDMLLCCVTGSTGQKVLVCLHMGMRRHVEACGVLLTAKHFARLLVHSEYLDRLALGGMLEQTLGVWHACWTADAFRQAEYIRDPATVVQASSNSGRGEQSYVSLF